MQKKTARFVLTCFDRTLVCDRQTRGQ